VYYFFAECPFLALYIKSAIGTQCVMGRITQCVMGRITQCVMGCITQCVMGCITQCVMGRITQCVMGRTTQCVMGRITLRLFKPDFGGKHLFTLFVQIISS